MRFFIRVRDYGADLGRRFSGYLEMSARAQALAQGLKTYFTGEPCKRGHSVVRYTSTRMCVMCATEHHQRRYADNPEKERGRCRAYNAANPEKRCDLASAYRAANLEKLRENSAAWYAANKEKARELIRQWNKNNPGARRAHEAKRRAMKLDQRCTCCTDAEIQKLYDIATLCGAGAHVDHIVQLALGGPHCAKNLEALTAEAHIEKSKRDAALRAESRRRNRLLYNWGHAAPVPDLPRVPTATSTAPLGPRVTFAASMQHAA
jgi:hypothetical protein